MLARFDYMGLVEGTTKGDSNELGKHWTNAYKKHIMFLGSLSVVEEYKTSYVNKCFGGGGWGEAEIWWYIALNEDA